jgi:1-acyl-sn-glycerol-3-phosphate acyltransferase
MPLTGPALLIANHQSYLDPILVGLASPRHLSFLARKTLFRHRLFGRLITALDAVPIDQDGVGKEGLQTILRQLQEGRAVLVFPEGSRTEDGRLDKLAPGIHLLIKRVQAPIVPIGIAGAFEAWPRTRLLPMPAPLFMPACNGALAVSVGRPVDGGRYAKMPREEVLKELFDRMQREFDAAEKLRRK